MTRRASPLLVDAAMFDSLYAPRRVRAALANLLPELLATPEITALSSTGFLTGEVLTRMVNWLDTSIRALPIANAGARLLGDLGCGLGLVGRHIADVLGTTLVGLDCAGTAISAARAAVSQLPESARPRFEVAEFCSTRLPEASVSAAFSLDALYLATDPDAALAEVRRILVPQGPLVFSVYVSSQHYPGTSVLLPDWRPLVARAGLLLERYENHSEVWRTIMRCKHERRWAARSTLLEEFGRRNLTQLAAKV